MVERKVLLYMILREFDGPMLKGFSNRLTLQKRIYLLQLFGINLGYRYNWYVYGPYSPSLTEEAFKLKEAESEIKKRSSTFDLAPKTRKHLLDYKKFESDLISKDLSKSLELAASIHFLKHIGFVPGRITKENIKKALKFKGKNFSDGEVNHVWSLLSKYGLIARKRRL